eukprot:gene3947-14024_t
MDMGMWLFRHNKTDNDEGDCEGLDVGAERELLGSIASNGAEVWKPAPPFRAPSCGVGQSGFNGSMDQARQRPSMPIDLAAEDVADANYGAVIDALDIVTVRTVRCIELLKPRLLALFFFPLPHQ